MWLANLFARLRAWMSPLGAPAGTTFVNEEPLAGLAGEASLLVTAFPGERPWELLDLGGGDTAIDEIERELDEAEMGRWTLDAHDWAKRAREAVVASDDPFREQALADEVTRQVGSRVDTALRANVPDQAARILAEYVQHARNAGT